MITKTINLYPYSELDEKAKQKALENLRDINTDYNGWDDYVIEGATEDLTALGFEDVKISYNGFYSQGDGASFTAHVNIIKFIEANKLKTRFAALYKFAKSEGSNITACVSRSGHYYHEMTMSAEVDGHLYSDVPDNVTKQGDDLHGVILEIARAQAKKIYRDLESEYEAQTGDEAIVDTIEANDYHFNASGIIESKESK
jgi:hypothetical protein